MNVGGCSSVLFPTACVVFAETVELEGVLVESVL